MNVPGYKFWEVGKRMANKTVYQNLLVNFKDADGREQTMTLELTQPSAREVHDAVEDRKLALAKAAAAAPAPLATRKEKTVHQKAAASQPKTETVASTAPKAQPETVASNAASTTPKAQPETATSAAEKMYGQEGWWGNQYWKTARNQNAWATQSAALGNQ